MQPFIRELFKSRIYGDEFLRLYEDMARTFTNDCIEELYSTITTRNTPFSFSEVNAKVASFNNELINRATWIREDYRDNKGYSSPKLTRGCKKIISNCVATYIRALEMANSSAMMQSSLV